MSETWKRWQDWATVVVGVALFITPFVFGTTDNSTASVTAYVGGVLLAIGGLWSLASPTSRSIEWAVVVVGALVFLAPWVLGFASVGAIAWSAWIGGVLAILLAGSVLLGARDRPAMVGHA